jgi:hypothetical protein
MELPGDLTWPSLKKLLLTHIYVLNLLSLSPSPI